MQLFYASRVDGSTAYLDEDESRHCTKTLRKKTGDTICFIDGIGGMYEGRITTISKKECQLEILNTLPTSDHRDFKIHIAIAPTKNIARTEWFLEKTTEFGIDEITFIRCKHSERKNIRLDRLQKIVQGAAKQSLKSKFPILNDLTPFKDFIRATNTAEKLIAHCHSSGLPHLKQQVNAQDSFVILIGPEGDFSREEVDLALEHNFQEISLGNSRLRTETAGIAACHTIHLFKS